MPFGRRSPAARILSRVRVSQLAGAFTAALAFAWSAQAGLACANGYTYAGIYARQPASGIASSLSMLAMPTIDGGHVAAWVGIGGPGVGPNGTDEWLQVGLASFGSPDGRLYYELAEPGESPRFVQLDAGILPGEVVRVAVMELPYAPSSWVVITPGGIAGPFYLPNSHGAWQPIATAESWAQGGSLCNSYAYRFDRIEVAQPGGAWGRLRRSVTVVDPGWRVRRKSPSSFTARRA
jgi:hypothetical protein